MNIEKKLSTRSVILDFLTIAAMLAALLWAYSAQSADPTAQDTAKSLAGYYDAGRVFVGSAGTFRLKDVADTQNITGAGGVAIQGGYHVVDNVALVGEAATENINHSVFDSVAGGLQAWIPIADSGLAPYGKALGGKQFEGDENWFVAGEAGLEVRGKLVGAFAGVRYQYDLEERSDVMLVVGINGHLGTK